MNVKLIPALPEGQPTGQCGEPQSWNHIHTKPVNIPKGSDVLRLTLTPSAQWAYNANKPTRGAERLSYAECRKLRGHK